jgi:DNA-binding HxlR family transcriptional regulator
LVKELKQLEKTGVLTRTAYATVPPTVEYALSEKGISLTPVLAAVQDWALKNMQTKN